MRTSEKLLEDSLLVIWNDRDAAKRLAAMKEIYAPDMHFYESNSGDAIIGHQAINDLISRLQSGWPVDCRFELNEPAQINHSTQIASWNLGPKGAPPLATGMDVAITQNDLIQSLYLFLDSK